MVHARRSDRSCARGRRFPGTSRRLVGAFDAVLPWDEGASAKFAALGARRIGPAGNLKFSSDPPAADPAALEALAGATAGRRPWLAASTHDGEETACLDRSEEHTSELQSLMRISYAVFCLKKKTQKHTSA